MASLLGCSLAVAIYGFAHTQPNTPKISSPRRRCFCGWGLELLPSLFGWALTVAICGFAHTQPNTPKISSLRRRYFCGWGLELLPSLLGWALTVAICGFAQTQPNALKISSPRRRYFCEWAWKFCRSCPFALSPKSSVASLKRHQMRLKFRRPADGTFAGGA